MEPELASQLPLDLELEADDTAVPVATFSDTATDELDVLLGKAVDVDSITKLVAEPNRTPVDYSGELDPESFDAEDDIITFVETPAVPAYVEPVGSRVQKSARVETDYELRKASKKPDTLLTWVKSMVAQGHSVESLIEYAKKSDPVVARNIETVWVNRDEPEAA